MYCFLSLALIYRQSSGVSTDSCICINIILLEAVFLLLWHILFICSADKCVAVAIMMNDHSLSQCYLPSGAETCSEFVLVEDMLDAVRHHTFSTLFFQPGKCRAALPESDRYSDCSLWCGWKRHPAVVVFLPNSRGRDVVFKTLKMMCCRHLRGICVLLALPASAL